MISIEIKTNSLTDIYKAVDGYREGCEKQLNAAIRVEGYRLMKLLKKQIRAGAPGGRRFAPLSFIARQRLHRGRNRPLEALANGVRYQVDQNSPISMRVGFVGPTSRLQLREPGRRESELLSKSWVNIAAKHQAGFTVQRLGEIMRRGSVWGGEGTETVGARLAREGSRMLGAKRQGYSRARFFFLRRSAGTLSTPARPIIAPFWASERKNALDNIRENFRRKMRGERI